MARISIRCADELLRQVDKKRGLIPRETFVRQLIIAGINNKPVRVQKPQRKLELDYDPPEEFEVAPVPPPGERRGKSTYQPYPKR